MSEFNIRPHHGLCIFFFEGKGYSPAFIRHMTDSIQILQSENPEIRLVPEIDMICQACPNQDNQICISAEKVRYYDLHVLQLCGMKENSRLRWSDFQAQVYEKILHPGRLGEICQDCQWFPICINQSPGFP